jgi:hypothetical protein
MALQNTNMLPTVNWLMGLTATSTGLKSALDFDQKGRRCRRSSSPTSSSWVRVAPYDRASRVVPQYHAATSDQTDDGEDLDASRPQFSFTCLIGLAILSSTQKELCVGQIYKYVALNFPFYKRAKATWRNSVRHVLSMNNFFQKAAGGPAKNGVWQIKPRMISVLLEHIAEGQQRLPPATCRHLGLPQLKKRVIKARIGRGRSWSACTTTCWPTTTATNTTSNREVETGFSSPMSAAAVDAAGTGSLPPPSASSCDGIGPLSFKFDKHEVETLARLQSSLGFDTSFEPSTPGFDSDCSTGSSSLRFTAAMASDTSASALAMEHVQPLSAFSVHEHTVPELDASGRTDCDAVPMWVIPPQPLNGDSLDSTFNLHDNGQVEPRTVCCQVTMRSNDPTLRLSIPA